MNINVFNAFNCTLGFIFFYMNEMFYSFFKYIGLLCTMPQDSHILHAELERRY